MKQPLAIACICESHLALEYGDRHRRHAQQLWVRRRTADQSRAARIPHLEIRRRRHVAEEADQGNRDVADVSAQFRTCPKRISPRIRTTACTGAATGGVWKPRESGTACFPPPANWTWPRSAVPAKSWTPRWCAAECTAQSAACSPTNSRLCSTIRCRRFPPSGATPPTLPCNACSSSIMNSSTSKPTALAERVKGAGNEEAQVRKAFEIVYQRDPSADELSFSVALLHDPSAPATPSLPPGRMFVYRR